MKQLRYFAFAALFSLASCKTAQHTAQPKNGQELTPAQTWEVLQTMYPDYTADSADYTPEPGEDCTQNRKDSATTFPNNKNN